MTKRRNCVIKIYVDIAKIDLYCEYYIFNGKMEGNYKEYYKNKQLFTICNYINGKKEGLCKKYYDNEQLYSECNYKNNKLFGKYKEYHENGELECEEYCDND